MEGTQGELERTEDPTAAEVLAAVAEAIDADGLQIERLEVRQATPVQYTYRVYEPGADDYEGGVITLDTSA